MGSEYPYKPSGTDYWHRKWLDAVDVLDELENVVTGHVEDGDKLDSFTTQPARNYLKECGRR